VRSQKILKGEVRIQSELSGWEDKCQEIRESVRKNSRRSMWGRRKCHEVTKAEEIWTIGSRRVCGRDSRTLEEESFGEEQRRSIRKLLKFDLAKGIVAIDLKWMHVFSSQRKNSSR
jgi:hypothetical protein